MDENSTPTTALVRVGPAPVSAPQAPAENPAAVYLARLAPGSRRTMLGALETIAEILTSGRESAATLQWSALRYQHTAAIRATLAERYRPATANKHLAALRGVLREAWQLGQIPSDEYARAAAVKAVKATTLPAGRALSAGEIRALFRACADGTRLGARDAAMLAILYGSGLRRSELVALDLADYNPETGAIAVRQGKGRKDRIAYATAGSQAALEAWLSIRGVEPGPLFCGVRKGGHLTRKRLRDQTVLDMLAARSSAAGVAHCSPHDLRRTFIGDLLDAGADIATVRDLAGHADVSTTARYDRRGEATKKRAADLLHVPYVG